MWCKTKAVAATSAACAVLCGVLAQGSRPACSSDELTCLDSAKGVIDELEDIVNPGTTCTRASEAFQDANGCVASCSGADLKELASTCETLSDRASEFSCNVYCEGITTNQNAYDEATAPSPVVLDANASWPAADVHGNFYAQPLERPGAQDFISQWSLPLGTGAEAKVSPIPLPNGNVAIVTGGDISEVSASGVSRWTVSLAQGEFASQPVADSNRYLYIGDTFGSMHKIDFRAGKLETSWNVGGSGISGAPALTSDFLFVVSKGSPGQAPILHKFPLREGTTGAWKLSVCEHDALRYDMVDDGLTITPDGVVLVACKWQAFVDAYDATNGEAIWSTSIVNASESVPFSTIIGVPVATSSQIFVTTHRAIVALDASTGTIQWTQNTDARPAGTVAVDILSNSVVTVLESGDIFQLDGTTGSRLADESVETLPVFGPIVDAEGHLVLASGNDILVYSIDDFNISSVLEVDSQVTAPPMLLDGRLMVHTQTSLVQLAATIGEGDNSLLEGETLAPVTSAPTTVTPSTSAPTSTPPPTIPATFTSSPTESQVTSSPTPAPTLAPTPAIVPTIPGSETLPPVTTASPTTRPTKQPTVTQPRDGDEDSPEWSSSAIAAVSTLATIDLILLAAAVGITAKKRKGAKSAGAATGAKPNSPDASAKAVQKRDIESTGQGLENNTNGSSIAAA